MLDRVRHVNVAAVDTGIPQCAIEQLPCRPNKWASRNILLIARLLADQHQPCGHWTFARHALGRELPQRAVAALIKQWALLFAGARDTHRRQGCTWSPAA